MVNRLKQHYAACSSNSQDLSIETIELSQEILTNDLSGEVYTTFVNMPRQVSSKERKICNTIGDYIVKTSKLELNYLMNKLVDIYMQQTHRL